MRPVDKYSPGYAIARGWVQLTLRNIFYRKVQVRGKEHLVKGKPLLIAPNHQNALMDALMVLMAIREQPIFLARADIFKKNFLSRILNWMKIMPVYRIRDGYDSLQKNDEIFEKCANVLGKGRTLIIFPEGNHGDRRTLRMLKKGLARVAFGAEQARDFKLGLQVIPAGVDYSAYEKFRARATVSFGEPINMSDFTDLYQEDAQKGMKALNEKIREGLFPHMMEIPWDDIYQEIMDIRSIYSIRFRKNNHLPGKNLFQKFDADKLLVEKISESLKQQESRVKNICTKVKEYQALITKTKMRDHVIRKPPYGIFNLLVQGFGLLVGYPLYLYGMINNYLIFKVPDVFSRRMKDKQFLSSIAYVLAFVVMLPIFYLLQTLIIAWVIPWAWAPWAYLITLIPTGLYAIHYAFGFKKWWSRIVFSWKKSKKNPDFLNLIRMRKEIVQELDELTA